VDARLLEGGGQGDDPSLLGDAQRLGMPMMVRTFSVWFPATGATSPDPAVPHAPAWGAMTTATSRTSPRTVAAMIAMIAPTILAI